MDKTPSQSTRSVKLRRWGQEVLDKACQGERVIEYFDSFCTGLLKHFQDMVKATAGKYQSHSAQRTYLWSTFHRSRVSKDLTKNWKEMLYKLNVNVDDSLLEQSVYQEVFEMCMQEYYVSKSSNTTECNLEVSISMDELNTMRYVCGYVACSLLKRYEKKSGEVYSQYATCLGEMAVEGHEGDEEDSVFSYTKRWLDQVNRGGLFPLNDETFHLFIEVEKCVLAYLSKYLTTSKLDKDCFKADVHDKIIQNEDIQFYWALLSQDIDCPNDAQTLLSEIIRLWVTIRGFSMAASWMEIYKEKESTNTEKSTGL